MNFWSLDKITQSTCKSLYIMRIFLESSCEHEKCNNHIMSLSPCILDLIYIVALTGGNITLFHSNLLTYREQPTGGMLVAIHKEQWIE